MLVNLLLSPLLLGPLNKLLALIEHYHQLTVADFVPEVLADGAYAGIVGYRQQVLVVRVTGDGAQLVQVYPVAEAHGDDVHVTGLGA